MEDDQIEEAIASFQRGIDREESFRGLAATIERWTTSFFQRRGESEEDAADLTQETLLRVYRGLEGFRGDSRFRTWVLQIAANTWQKAVRTRHAKKREGIQVSLEVLSTDSAATVSDTASSREALPLDDALDDERRRHLQAAIAALPQQMRICLILRIHQEMSYREIALLLGLSTETVKAHLYQARRRLRQDLERVDIDAQ